MLLHLHGSRPSSSSLHLLFVLQDQDIFVLQLSDEDSFSLHEEFLLFICFRLGELVSDMISLRLRYRCLCREDRAQITSRDGMTLQEVDVGQEWPICWSAREERPAGFLS